MSVSMTRCFRSEKEAFAFASGLAMSGADWIHHVSFTSTNDGWCVDWIEEHPAMEDPGERFEIHPPTY